MKIKIRKTRRTRHPHRWLAELSIPYVCRRMLIARAATWEELIAKLERKFNG